MGWVGWMRTDGLGNVAAVTDLAGFKHKLSDKIYWMDRGLTWRKVGIGLARFRPSDGWSYLMSAVISENSDSGGRGAIRRHGVLAIRLALVLVLVACGWQVWAGRPAEVVGDTRAAALAGHVRLGMWQGAWFNLVLAAGLLATSGWWMRPGGVAAGAGRGARVGVRFWLAVLPVAGLALWLRAPLLDHSLYADEVYSLNKFIHGEWRLDKQGAPRFREATWQQTLWGYQRPNNHICYSISARLAHEAWQAATGAPRHEFNKRVLRLPALAASLASILVGAWVLWSYGHRAAGWLAAMLAAVHPWHISHSVEIRGYGFVFLFGSLILLAARGAVERGGWAWWAGLAAGQFLMLYTYPSALYILVPLTLVLVGLVVQRHLGTPGLAPQLGRLVAANAVMAGLLVQLMLPCLPQLREYLAAGAPQGGSVSPAWVRDVAGLFLAGKQWHPWDGTSPVCHTIEPLLQASPGLAALLLGLAAGLGLLGYARLAACGGVLFWLLLPFWLAPALAAGHALASGAYLFTWYVIFSLPVWLMCLALGLDAPRGLPGLAKWRGKLAAQLPALVLLGVFLAATAEQRRIVRRHPVEPVRELVAAMHRARDAADCPPVLAALFVNAPVYDPAIRRLGSVAEVRSLQREAAAAGRRLWLGCGFLPMLAETQPEFFDALTETGEFEPLAVFHGREFTNRSSLLAIFDPLHSLVCRTSPEPRAEAAGAGGGRMSDKTGRAGP
jgi:hypothetical protein